MKTLNKTLMTSAAALALVAGSAFAQTASTDVDATTGAAVEAGDAMSADAGVAAEAGVTADAESDTLDVAADTDTSADVDATTETDMAADTDMSADAEAETDMMAQTEVSDDMMAAADLEISTLIGVSVASEEGNDVGEIDSFVEDSGQLWAVVGIGGFLGLGEHNVAIELDKLAVSETNDDGAPTKFMIKGHTEAELKAMQEYDNANAVMIDSSTSLRSAMSM